MKYSNFIFLVLMLFSLNAVSAQESIVEEEISCCYIQSVDFSNPVLSSTIGSNVKTSLSPSISLTAEAKNGEEKQQFQIITAGDGFFYIKNIDLGKALTFVENEVFLSEFDQSDNQKFELVESSKHKETGYIKPKGEWGVVQILEDGKLGVRTCEVNVKTDFIAGQRFEIVECE